ncbi:hypothetical protein QVD17_38766 [Tagetes erecta]|uniref:Sacsin/Nov domain-containing protein n=1 Tax=Tagetes erecta TaxID=13708 RepID=A0AAD8JSQ5_TARER|nr:hypothetical protein QVD17_38766 [Tagetes erecta]
MALMISPAKQHVAEIRRTKFSIGGEPNPLTEDLHQAVKKLSDELYAKDVHFLMELIQNAEDNEYPEGVDPSLEFVITSKDITNTGASATLLVFNNEIGFSRKNIDSICSVGRSTKKDLRKHGYIGEKGIGFKSVFLITAQPYIFSNGYQIRFNEKPCQHCNLGYVVPEWVDEDPTLEAIKSIYGLPTALPTTILVLPLKSAKVKQVKNQLSSVHPELLLFLSKIKQFSIREFIEDPKLNTVREISISSEKNSATSKSKNVDFYKLRLTVDDIHHKADNECSYFMWKQRFPVKKENKVDMRREVDEWVITLAFPLGKRLTSYTSFPGIYSFLPTETVTNFPFIIQADFLLASSRENILWDNKWNQGILDCVPLAFVSAFVSMVKSVNANVSSFPGIFQLLPVHSSTHPKLNCLRDIIKAKLMNENIVPYESYSVKNLFGKPKEVYRLKPAFSSILSMAANEGVNLHNISSHGAYLLDQSFDEKDYDAILDFLEIQEVDCEWYAKCIANSNLVMGVSEDVYIQLLLFLAEDWDSLYHNTNIRNVPLLKYVDLDGNVELFNINAVSCSKKLLVAGSSRYASWLINWNKEFGCTTGQFFFPIVTQEAIRSCSERYMLENWLKYEANVTFVNVGGYARHVCRSLKHERQLTITYAHFLCLSLKKNYLQKHDIKKFCDDMPYIVKGSGATVYGDRVLVPANGSNWGELFGVNLWEQHGYDELVEDYTRDASYFGNDISGKELVYFLETCAEASDIPHLSPPDAAIPTMFSPLSKENALSLLVYLGCLRFCEVDLPESFLSSIKCGSWLKVCCSGSPEYRPPSESFMLDSSTRHLLQNGPMLVDIPLVDTLFYGNEIKEYKKELKICGVRFKRKDVFEYIGKRLTCLATSSELTRDNVFSILQFIRYLGANHLSASCIDFIKSVRGGKWLRTSQGYMTPSNSILFSNEWNVASQISDIPIINQDYYGEDLLSFKRELNQLSVVVNFNPNCYQIVSDNLKSSLSFTSLSSDATFLILRCLQKLNPSDKLVRALQNKNWLRTNLGNRCPSECFLISLESNWGCLMQVFKSFPILDEEYYGKSIFSMSQELKKIGVTVDFEDASKAFTCTFKQHASSFSLTKEHVLSFLSCYRYLKEKNVKLPLELLNCIHNEKWLQTKSHGYRSPNECILFGNDWEPISSISLLPFINDCSYFYGNKIHCYKEELKQLGVTTDFKDSAKFVAMGVVFLDDFSTTTPATTYALLDSLKKLEKTETDIRGKFVKLFSRKKMLKTNFGYKRPNECLLFSPAWDPFLKCSDGPFLDEVFYGNRIRFYKEELNVLGVITDVNNGCRLVSSYLNSHTNFLTISRIYNYLSEFKWKPADDDSKKIWIPQGTDNGKWVDPNDCVLYDENKLFGEKLNVLEKFKYEKKTLDLFANTFNVKVHPSVEDYCKLWKNWESSGHQITNAECCAFWDFVVKNWNSKTEKTFKNNLSKLPVLDRTFGGILLFNKNDVFIGDDLFLTSLFKSCSRTIFVWFPQPTINFLTRNKLVGIYTQLGVRTLSESVHKRIPEVDNRLVQINPREKINKKGLLKLILGFLADPCHKLDTERRHEAVSRLLAVEAFETLEPQMTVGYSLSLTFGDVLNVEDKRMIWWDKNSSKLFTTKIDNCCGFKNAIEYVCQFSEVIADGVLWENEELVPQLSELIKLGFLVLFDDKAVDSLMKAKNLQISAADQRYLSSIFSS